MSFIFLSVIYLEPIIAFVFCLVHSIMWRSYEKIIECFLKISKYSLCVDGSWGPSCKVLIKWNDRKWPAQCVTQSKHLVITAAVDMI